MGWNLGKYRVHSASKDDDDRPKTKAKRNSYLPFSTMLLHEEDRSKGNGNMEDGSGDDNIMLGFQNVSISADDPPKHIVANVSGFVVKGGITAVLGPSSSGKSVLMKVLTGRLPTLSCAGEVTFCGKRIDPNSQDNGFGFVPQEDSLIGDLTIRETFEVAARLRNVGTIEEASKASNEVIDGLGLSKVGDNVVGTILKRGLSGGEKRRTTVGQELVVKQAMAFLDEPTSGLDGTAAYDVLKTVRDFTTRSKGSFSVIMSIHQPNGRILELFDHILLLGRGGSIFFGTLPEAIQHFTDIGHPPPAGQVPTDFFMQASTVTEGSFALPTMDDINFTQVYATSDTHANTVHALEISKAKMLVRLTNGIVDPTFERPGFLRQLSTLLWRDSVVAVRDPTLYYLQFVLHVLYGFFVGTTFWNVPTTLDDRQTQLAASCMWIIMLQSYVHVFKVFYLVNSNRRFANERSNLSYGVTSFFLAETIVTCLAQLLWVPGCSLAFFMIGLPADAYLFSMLALYVGALAAEGMINLITKFTNNPSIAIVISQAALVILTVFGGGIFIPFDEIPEYWSWVEVWSVYKHCSRAFLMAVFEHVLYDCPSGSVTLTTPDDSTANQGWCTTFQDTYECNESFDDNTMLCEVEGTVVLDINAGGLSGNKWNFLGHTIALIVVFRAGVFFFLKFPKEDIIHAIKSRLASPVVSTSLQHQSEIQMLWGEIVKLKKAATLPVAPAAMEEATAKPSTQLQRRATLNALREEGEGMVPSGNSAENAQEKALVFRDITLKLRSKEKILIDSVTGKATAGRVLALMGPSGAGKTTLLNALGGRATYGEVSGAVTLGGRPLTSEDLNYVPQFDEHSERFTPREILTYMKHLQVVPKPRSNRKSVIELLHILGLSLKADVMVGTLSGGEQKRLSIGMGMVAEPEVLFLDEPTTGLDSASAHSVVKYISNLARQTNVVCIMTIHQPASEVFDMIEDLMLMESGKLTYFGTTKNARSFFDSLAGDCPSSVNPADYYLDLISQPPSVDVGKGATWQELYYNSEFNIDIPNSTVRTDKEPGDDDGDGGRPRPHWSVVARTLLDTQLEYYWRATEVHWFRILELIVLAIFVGTMYFRLGKDRIAETAAAAFFNMWCALFAVVASVPAFARDRRRVLQEMLNGAYGPTMYCCTQLLASAPFILVSALVYQSIFHWLVGFNDSVYAYIYAVLLTASLLFMMEAIMLMVVETLKNAMLACTFSIVVLGALFLFAGFFIK
ncbi:unnamed protein product, partial [Ectocarpus sp. 12 AP-2014]